MQDATKPGARMLREGLDAARAGNLMLAQELFVQANKENPNDELGWICLAAVSSTPITRVTCLERAILINPENARTQEMLTAVRKQLSDAIVHIATEKLLAGNRAQAENLLLGVTQFDRQNEDAWVGLSSLIDAREEREVFLRLALEVNPASSRLKAILDSPDEHVPTVPVEIEQTPAAALPLEIEQTPVAALPLQMEQTPVAVLSLEIEQTPVAVAVEPDKVIGPSENLSPGIEASPLGTAIVETIPVDTAPTVEEPGAKESQPSERCHFCLEELSEDPRRCSSCGGVQQIFDPRMDNSGFDSAGVDQRRMWAALNRITGALRESPLDPRLHFALGLAYLNLNRLDRAIWHLKRAQDLRPSMNLEEGLNLLSQSAAGKSPARSAADHPTEPPEIPLTHCPETANPEVQAGSVVDTSADTTPSNGKVVLVVDDSATVRATVSLTLERQGYQVVTATDGSDGLNKLEEISVDLVLLDVMMPNLDGHQVCRTIRHKNKTVPVVMLTGKDGLFDKMRAKMAGSTNYMTKPFEQDVLVTTVHQYCFEELKGDS